MESADRLVHSGYLWAVGNKADPGKIYALQKDGRYQLCIYMSRYEAVKMAENFKSADYPAVVFCLDVMVDEESVEEL